MKLSSDNGCNQILSYRLLSKFHLLTGICLNILLSITIFVALVFLIRIKVQPSYNIVKPDLLCSERVAIALPKNVTASYCNTEIPGDVTLTYRNMSSVLNWSEMQAVALRLSSDIFVPLSERFSVSDDNSVIVDGKIILSPASMSNDDVNEFLDNIKVLARM